LSADREGGISELQAFGPAFDENFRDAFALLLRWRRDVRHFRKDPLDAALLQSLLDAACLAPSVGYSQPWRFVTVESAAGRAAVKANFEHCNAEALAEYEGSRARQYATLKLAGLSEAPVQLAVFTDAGTAVGHGLGRRTMPATLDYSTVMAIQNFWLAARASGIGVGWVSILDAERLATDLDIPTGWRFTAYLCVGYPERPSDEPELARLGWEAPHGPSRELLSR
jgi:5,6-dimethylbenzimidazole synthase